MTPNGVLLAYSTPAHVPTLRHQAALVGDAWEKVVRSLHRPAPSRNVSSSRLKSPSSPLARAGQIPRITSGDLTTSAFNSSVTTVSSSLQNGDVDAIILQIGDKNLIVKAIQPSILIVLVGITAPKEELALRAAHEIVGVPSRGLSSLRPPSQQSSIAAKPAHLSIPGEADAQADAVSVQSGHSRNESGYSVSDSSAIVARQDVNVDLLHIQKRKLDRIAEYIKSEFDKEGFVMPYDLSK